MANSTLCELSDKGRAISSMLTGSLGGIITGLSSHFLVTFSVTWICLFATLRIVLVGIWEVIEALRLKSLDGEMFWGLVSITEGGILGLASVETMNPPSPPSLLGWLGWVWSACYSPVAQALWLVENWDKATPGLKVVRAIGVSVTALSQTIDTRARYGKALGRTVGSNWADRVFTLLTASGCLGLGIVASTELILAAQEIHPVYIAMYCIFLSVWTTVSFLLVHPQDGVSSTRFLGIHARLAMTVMCSFWAACPAFIVWAVSEGDGVTGMGLVDFLRCRSVETWRKLACVLP